MKVTKYVTPASSLDAVFDRLGFGLPAIDRFFGDFGPANGEGWSAVRVPRTNIHETDSAFVFTMEMPGLSRQDIDVNIEGETLVIKGGKSEQSTGPSAEKSPQKSEEKGLLRREYRATRFERTFHVGNAIDRDQVRAKMEDGILTVTLPKSAEKAGRKIDVA